MRLVELLEGRRLLAASAMPVVGSIWSADVVPVLSGDATVAGRHAYYSFKRFDNAGTELYRTDGTPAGTRMVRERSPGSSTGGGPWSFTPLGSDLLYFGPDGNGNSLFRTDGTEAGTTRIFDFASAQQARSLIWMEPAGGRVFMTLNNPATQRRELWVSDGTTAGTVAVATNFTGIDQSTPPGEHGLIDRRRTVAGGKLYFRANAFGGPTTGRQLWVSDGTAEGTMAVATPLFPDSALGLYLTTSTDQFVYFYSVEYLANGDDQVHIYRLDPATQAATILTSALDFGIRAYVTAIVPGPKGLVYFRTTFAASVGGELFVTDGTVAGTRLLADLRPGRDSSDPGDFEVVGDWLYFTALQGRIDREVFRTDGTPAGTIRLTDDSAPTVRGDPKILGSINGRVVFTAGSSVGLVSTLEVTTNARATLGLTNATTAVRLNDRMLFNALGTDGRGGMFASDGTAAGTQLAVPRFGNALPPVARRAVFEAAGRPLYFDGASLRRFDGTVPGTVTTVATIAGGISVSNRWSFGDYALFTIPVADTLELWRTDGTEVGTMRLASLTGTGRAVNSMVRPGFLGGSVLFTGTTAGTPGLYRLDPSSGAVTLLRAFTDFSPDFGMNPIVVGDQRVAFFAGPEQTGREVWTSDGTPSGTVQRTSFNDGSGRRRVWDDLAFRDGHFYLAAGNAAFGDELYTFPESAGAAVRLTDLFPGALGSSPRYFFVGADGIYFSATVPDGPGSVEGILRVRGPSASEVDFVWRSNPTLQQVYAIGELNGRLLIASWNFSLRSLGPNGADDELVPVGQWIANPESFFQIDRVNGIAHLAVDKPGLGAEPWVTDGTVAGTRLLRDLNPGSLGSNPRSFAFVNGQAYFVAQSRSGFPGYEQYFFASSDQEAPLVASAQMLVDERHAVRVRFSEQININSLNFRDATFVRQSDGAAFPSIGMSVDGDRNGATFTPDRPLPDGVYRLEFAAGAVFDESGNPSAAASIVDRALFALAGDATRDQTVNFDDLLILASNYNQSSRLFTQGDFNYDGTVNFDDLLLLAANYNQSLAGHAPPAVGAMTSPPPRVGGSAAPRGAWAFSAPPVDDPDDGGNSAGVLA